MPYRFGFFNDTKVFLFNTAKGSMLTSLFGGIFNGSAKATDSAGCASVLTSGLFEAFHRTPDTNSFSAVLIGSYLTAATANLLDKTLDLPAGSALLISSSIITLTCLSINQLLNTSGLDTRQMNESYRNRN